MFKNAAGRMCNGVFDLEIPESLRELSGKHVPDMHEYCAGNKDIIKQDSTCIR